MSMKLYTVWRNSDCIGLPGDQAAKSTNQCIATVVSSKPNPALQIGGFGLMCTPQMHLVENFALIMLRKLVLQLQDRFCSEILEGLSSHLGHGDISSGSEASIFEVRNLTAWCQFQLRVDQVMCQQFIATCL